MDRRNFLRMGSLAVLGSLAAPSLALPDTVRGALGGTDNKSAVAAAMKHFGVTEADLKKVLTVALEKGGDYADLYFEHSFNNAVALMDGKVNNCMFNLPSSVYSVIERVFKIKVRIIPTFFKRNSQHLLQVCLRYTEMLHSRSYSRFVIRASQSSPYRIR